MSPSNPLATTAALSSAHDALAPLLPILDAFNHRHHNQHRASHWWSQLSLLRRALLVRCRWLSRHAVPQCYLAFSQLTADNQYAPLGLLLLSVLARLNAEIVALLPEEKPSTVDAPVRVTLDAASSSLTQDHDADRGTAVSRRDIAMTYDKPDTSERPSKSRAVKAKSVKPSKSDKKQKKTSSKKKDEFSSLFGSLT
jgi:ribonuclease MRP protein subunit RMP1